MTTADIMSYADHIESLQSHQCRAVLFTSRADVAQTLREVAEHADHPETLAYVKRLALLDYTRWSEALGTGAVPTIYGLQA